MRVQSVKKLGTSCHPQVKSLPLLPLPTPTPAHLLPEPRSGGYFYSMSAGFHLHELWTVLQFYELTLTYSKKSGYAGLNDYTDQKQIFENIFRF